MNYEYYKIFFFVGKHKNITRAAEELFSSQPAVTRVIRNMETELGCRLFVRNKAGVEFTKEGKELYERIESPCNLLLHTDQSFTSSMGWKSDTIHIGATYTALQCFLFEFLETFRKKYPSMHFKIYTGSSSRMIAKLSKGEVDLVFNTTPFSSAPSLSVTPVHELTDILVGGREYRKLSGLCVSLRDIQKYPFVLLSRKMQYRQFCDDFFFKHGIHVEPVMEADSTGLIVPIVVYNWGLAFVPQAVAMGELVNGNLVEIELKESIPKRKIMLVTDTGRPLSKAARLMCEMVSEEGHRT